MKIQGNVKVYETKDASFNFTINYDFRRFLLGFATTNGTMRGVVGMRMFVFHVAFTSICFTSFFQLPQLQKKNRGMHRSHTRRYGRKKGR